jgi:hypothetical protein
MATMITTSAAGLRDPVAAAQTAVQMLEEAPSYRLLEPAAQQALAESLGKVASYLAAGEGAPQLAEQLAPDLSVLRRTPTQTPARPGQQPAPSPASAGGGAPATGGGGTVGRVGEVTRATLNAIDFPQFVAALIQGTFQAIVDASIQQMEAYAELLKNVAQTVDRFMGDNISEGTAKDYLADEHPGLFSRDLSGGAPRLTVNPDASNNGELPSFFQDLGFTSAQDIDDNSIDEVIVPQARRNLAQQRQQTLATMVMMGINRVLVSDGEILAKLQFHIDASETTGIKFDQQKITTGSMSGRAGRNPFSANALMVNTTSLNAQSDINIRTDLTGQVKVNFRSEAFPLERFADSAAIQLINENARVPQPTPAAAAPGTVPAVPGIPGVPSPVAPPLPPTTAPPPTPTAPSVAAQELAEGEDAWAPEARR